MNELRIEAASQTLAEATEYLVKRQRMMTEALEQAQSCILGETPEDCTPEEAREDTLQKIRTALGL